MDQFIISRVFFVERFNGVLGHVKTNQRAVELQLKFLQDQDLPFPSLSKEQVRPVLSRMKTSVMDPIYDVTSAAEHLSQSQGPVTNGNLSFNTALTLHGCLYITTPIELPSYSALLQGVEFQN